MSSYSVSQSPANKAHECCLFRPRPTANWIKFYKHNPENPILPLSSCTATVRQISGHQSGPDLALNMPGKLTPFGCPCCVPPTTNISQLLFVLIPIIRTNGEFSFGVIGFRVIMLPLPPSPRHVSPRLAMGNNQHPPAIWRHTLLCIPCTSETLKSARMTRAGFLMFPLSFIG